MSYLKKPRAMLTIAQKIAVYNWAKSKLATIQGRSDASVAELATADLGFTVSESSIRTIRTDGDIDIAWGCTRPGVSTGKKEQYAYEQRVIMRQIRDIAAKLAEIGAPVFLNDDFNDLYKRKNGHYPSGQLMSSAKNDA